MDIKWQEINWQGIINYSQLLSYLGVLLVLVGIYLSVGKWIKKAPMPIEQKRRSLNRLRIAFFLLVISSFFITWASEIYSVIISLTAIAAALAIATKELLLCLAGSFYKAVARPFTVGDRILIGELRGDVIEIGLFSTTLLEVGPKDMTHQYTGRSVAIPNSKFLSEQVVNETFSHEFTLHVFTVTVKNNEGWEKERDMLLESAKISCDQYVESAKRHYQRISERRQLDPPFVEPRINIRIPDAKEIQLIVRVTVPVRARGRIEQDILENYLKTKFKKD